MARLPRPRSTGQLDPALLLAAWMCAAFAIALRFGNYTPLAVALVVLSLGFAVLGAFRPLGRSAPWRVAVAGCALVTAVAPAYVAPTNHGHGTWYLVSLVASCCAAAATVLTLVRDRLVWVALAAVFVAGVTRVLGTPVPPIDVHFLLTDSTRGLLTGHDLYRQTWPGSHGLFDVYPYLPWTSVLLLPGWLLTHEVRYGLLVADLVAALLTRRLAGAGRVGSLLGLLLVGYPLFTYGLQQSWTEPLLLALLAGMLLAVTRGRTGVAMVCFAVALATKQHVLLLVPLAALWPAFGPRRTARSLGLALLLISPWIIAGPRDLWHDAVTYNLGYPVLRNALDVPALLIRHGILVGFAVPAVSLLVAYGAAWRWLPRTVSGFAAGGAVVELLADVLNKQSFFNHYTLPMGLLVFAAASSLTASAADADRVRGEGLVLVRPAVRDDQGERRPADLL